MTNTIPNVPRDWFDRVHALLYKVAYENTPEGLEAECLGSFIPDILSAPSPAGVDGLEVIGWYTDDHLDDKSATTYSREVADRWLAKGWPVTGIANAAAAQAIIDGLRDQIHVAHEKVGRYADQRDQQAHRIGELEGLLRACHSALCPFDNKVLEEKIDAALSAGKEGE